MPIDILRYAWTRNYLSHFTEVFLALLAILAIYEVYFACVVLKRLRFLRTIHDKDSLRQNLAWLNHRSANLQQMILAMSYFFGVTFFIQIGSAYFTPESNRPVGLMVLENLNIYFAFAAVVFLVLLVFHLVQWFLSVRIHKAAFQMPERSPTELSTLDS